MHSQINDIIRQLFKKNALEEVSDAELAAFIAQYPYVSAGHYLRAQKIYDRDPSAVADEQQTAVLYIHNPLWLPWLLSKNYAGAAALSSTDKPDDYNSAREAYVAGVNEEAAITPETGIIDTADNADTEPLSGLQAPDDTAALREADTPGDITPLPSEKTDENEIQPAVTNALADAEPQATPAELAASANDERDRPIAFQSYHTIDYFASQGIRLQASDLSKDKLGQQLKSFTDWLKSMKKLSVAADDPAKEADPEEVSLRKRVVSIAEHSLEDKEILTEAMAEVWAKQGNARKAAAIYQKLSLQNPHKNAYFAAKIKQLNVS